MIYLKHLRNHLHIIRILLAVYPYTSMTNETWEILLGHELGSKVLPEPDKKGKKTLAKSIMARLIIGQNKAQSKKFLSMAWKILWRYGKGQPIWIHHFSNFAWKLNR